MSNEQHNAGSGAFAKAFMPGLVLGLVVGLFGGVFASVFIQAPNALDGSTAQTSNPAETSNQSRDGMDIQTEPSIEQQAEDLASDTAEAIDDAAEDAESMIDEADDLLPDNGEN